MTYYAIWYSELPKTFAKALAYRKGILRKYNTLVDARRYAAKLTMDKGGVVMIYSKNVEKYMYAINNPLQNPDLLGYVDYKGHMNWNYWNIPDTKDRFTGEVYFKSRPMYTDGKMAGRF